MKDLRLIIALSGLTITSLLFGKGIYEVYNIDKNKPKPDSAYYFGASLIAGIGSLVSLNKYEKYRIKKLEKKRF